MTRLSVLVLVLLFSAVGSQAQAPTSATAAPALSDLETAYVQIVSLADQLAQCQARQLDSVKQFTDVQKDVIARIEKAHPGYTLDFATNALVPKKAAK